MCVCLSLCVCIHVYVCVYANVCLYVFDYDLCLSGSMGAWVCHDVCIGQGTTFLEWALALYFVLRQSVYCFCHLTTFSSLACLQVSRQFPCLCLLFHCRSAGITYVHYCIWPFYVDFPWSELKC